MLNRNEKFHYNELSKQFGKKGIASFVYVMEKTNANEKIIKELVEWDSKFYETSEKEKKNVLDSFFKYGKIRIDSLLLYDYLWDKSI